MTAPRIPADLSKRYRKLIHELDQIYKTIPSTGDPKLAKAGAAILSVLEFLQPPGSAADMSKLTGPLWSIATELFDRRRAQAQKAEKSDPRGRSRVPFREVDLRAVAVACVNFLAQHSHKVADARKIVASQLSAAGCSGLPNHSILKRWEMDWMPKQPQASGMISGHISPEVMRQDHLAELNANLTPGTNPVALSAALITHWVSAK